jgi:hypothetical protein
MRLALPERDSHQTTVRAWLDCGAPTVTRVSASMLAASAEKEFELSDLVATGGDAIEVIALQPDVGAHCF